MELSKKQIRAISKTEKLILEAERLFNEVNLSKDWCPIFGQTETAICRTAGLIKHYADYKLKRC